MLKLCLIFIVLCNFNIVFANAKFDSLLLKLDKTLELREQYMKEKKLIIDKFSSKLNTGTYNNNPEMLFEIYCDLLSEYESFVFDSAFNYTKKIQTIAYQLNDPSKIAYAKMKTGFILLSSGMFHEAIDTLRSTDTKALSDKQRIEYYRYISRAYFDLADYSNDSHYASYYNYIGNCYIDSILYHHDIDNYTRIRFSSLNYQRKNNFEMARLNYLKLIADFELSSHESAITNASLGFIYHKKGEINKAIEHLSIAAIEDTKSSVKETTALRRLAEIIYDEGNLDKAHKYILLAEENANFYGSRQRKIQISHSLPRIEGEQLKLVKKQKEKFFLYALATSLLTGFVCVFSIIIIRQLLKLRKARKKRIAANQKLTELNEHLSEANKIKEDYIGYYFNFSSQYINKLESLKKAVDRQIITNRLSGIKTVINNIDIKRERQLLFSNFDKIFLNLFPNFIYKFNAFFIEEDKIKLKDNDMLNTDLRIFALIRLGITDNGKIAEILNFSVNTIYTYKTKIKKRSILTNDEFEEKIMEIKSV